MKMQVSIGLSLLVLLSCSQQDPNPAEASNLEQGQQEESQENLGTVEQDLDSTLITDDNRVALNETSLTFDTIGTRVNTFNENNVMITEGAIRVRRRHENDMDYSKYNPFYWEGRLTHFRVEDYTRTGVNRIKFFLTTEWPQDYIPTRGPDFSAIYKGNPDAPSETERSKFDVNVRMNHIGDNRRFEASIEPLAFQQFPDQLQKGKLLTFEFRFFNAESFPDWQKQKAQNGHNLSAYYSEFLRIRIGEAGLFIDNPADTRSFPSALRHSGGWTTTPTTRVEPWRGLQQQAWNLNQASNQKFLNGRTWFHTDMQNGQHQSDDGDDKPSVFFESMRSARSNYAGSIYSVKACTSCHLNNGIALLPPVGSPVTQTIVKTHDKSSGTPHPQFGGQLQTAGMDSEGTLILSGYENQQVTLNDGTIIPLKRPHFTIQNSTFDTSNLGLSPRKPPAMIGLGLLEAVPEQTLRDLAKANKGELRLVNGKVGRFGWKASQSTVKSQIMAALNNDMGVTSPSFPNLDCPTGACSKGKGQVPKEAVDQMSDYLSLLGVPPRMKPEDPQVQRGERVFDQLSCQSCHVKLLRTGTSEHPELSNQSIQAFTDLLLHDMGEGLADSSGDSLARKWRTAPLWGLKNVRHATNTHSRDFPTGSTTILWTETHKVANRNPIQLLHDGRASSLAEAILWHGGEASESVTRYKALSKAEREDLDAYLWDL